MTKTLLFISSEEEGFVQLRNGPNREGKWRHTSKVGSFQVRISASVILFIERNIHLVTRALVRTT